MDTTLKIIKRPVYLDRLIPYVGKNLIKVLIGQRRVGKSYILILKEENVADERLKIDR